MKTEPNTGATRGPLLDRCLHLLARVLISLRYRVRVRGLEDIRSRGASSILFLPNHPALVDPLIVTTLLWPDFHVRPVADEGQAAKPLVGWLARRLRAVLVPDMTREGAAGVARAEESTRQGGRALRHGDNLLFYPAGRLMRSSREDLRGNSGVERLLREASDCRVVLLRTSGLWGSSFSRANGEPGLLRDFWRNLEAIVCSAVFFLPRREVLIELYEPQDMPRNDSRININRYLESYYNAVERPNTIVPLFPWQGRTSKVVPEPRRARPNSDASAAPRSVRVQVAAFLSELSGQPVEWGITAGEPEKNRAHKETGDHKETGEDKRTGGRKGTGAHKDASETENAAGSAGGGRAAEGAKTEKVVRAEDTETPDGLATCHASAPGQASASTKISAPSQEATIAEKAGAPGTSSETAGPGSRGSTPQERQEDTFAPNASGEQPDNAGHSGHGARLTADLGLDSLAMVDLGLWLEREFGLPPSATDSLKTVADVMLAASGVAVGGAERSLTPPPAKWFDSGPDMPLTSPGGENIAQLFLNQARRDFSRIIVADQRSGVRTYRDLITGIFALRPAVEKLEGDAVGIMLPASVGAVAAWLAVLFSGRVPAMVNWTVGPAHVEHCLKQAGVRAVLTSRVLLERLHGRGVVLDVPGVRFVCLEDLAAALTLRDKVRAKALAHVGWKSLYRVPMPERAVILFTSGSEARPKGVPLTHANFLSELQDFVQVLAFRSSDRLLAMLPPFHSLGLAGTLFMPLVLGLRTVYHPDPTEGRMLAQSIAAYGITFSIAAPTFLDGILRQAGEGDLQTLRLVFTGAEKCPEHVYAAMGDKAPQAMLLEGYGVTECAPLISLDRPDDPRPGSIGRLIPSMQARVVHPETLDPVDTGERGLLLVRGGNVFAGYLDPSDRQPFVELPDGRWYDTGDLVSMDGEGVLRFRGRLGRFVKLGGEMISLAAVEEVLLGAFAHRGDGEGPPLAVEAGGSEEMPELVLFVTFDMERAEANRAVRRAGLSGLHNVRRVKRLDDIPVLGTGKTDYKVLRKLARRS